MEPGADALSRHTGQVQFAEGEDGVEYAGRLEGEDLGTAAMKAFGARTIENYSEMFGEYFSPIGKMLGKTKVANALSATKVGKMIDNVRASEIGKAVTDFESRTHWNGVLGEYGEEVVGTMMNALTVGDNEMSDVMDWDQQVDTFLGVSLMGGFLSGLKTFGYRTPKYSVRKKLEKADKRAYKELGDYWEEIKRGVDESTEEDRKNVLVGVLTSEELTPEQKRAVLDYSSNYTKFEGIMKADSKKVEEGEKTEFDADLEQAYEEGTTLSDVSEKQAAKMDLNVLSEKFSDERLEELNGVEHPGQYIHEHEEEADVLIPFFNAKARYEGMVQGIRDDIEDKVEVANQFITGNTHKDGRMYPVTLKDAENSSAYVVAGNLVLNEAGEIDRERSDDRCIINNGGKLEMRSIKDIGMLLGVDDPETLKAFTTETIRQQEALKAENEIEKPEGDHGITPGEELTLDIAGNGVYAVVQQATPNGTWLVQFEHPVKIGEETGRVFELTKEQIGKLGSKPIESVKNDRENVTQVDVEQGKLETGDHVAETKVDYPRNENDEIDYARIDDPGVYVSALKEEFGDEAEGVLEELIVDKSKELEKAEKTTDTVKRKRLQKRLGGELAKLKAVKEAFLPAIETEQINGNNTLQGDDNSLSSQNNQVENEVFESIPQGEYGTVLEEDSGQEKPLDQLRRRIEEASRNAPEGEGSRGEGSQSQKELNRSIEADAKTIGAWTPFQDISNLGVPFLSGNENDVYLDKERGVLYKVNNLMNSGNLSNLFKRIDQHNEYFPPTKYELVGFTGFGDGRAVYPIFKQEFIDHAEFATPKDIDAYMQSLGFRQTGVAEYENDDVVISDLRPRNVLKDIDGDIYVIDADFKERAIADVGEREQEAIVNTNPSEAQKEAGNYKKGHVKVDGYEITIENPKGSERNGVDSNGQPWSVKMNNTYGYIRGTEGVDGDHIDVFLSDNPEDGQVYVVDQVDEDGQFDEHKVMYGFNSEEEARESYLRNYSPGWNGLGNITGVSKELFSEWMYSSRRKTKPFSEYKIVKEESEMPVINQEVVKEEEATVVPEDTYSSEDGYKIERRLHKKNGTYIYALNFTDRVDRDAFKALKAEVKNYNGYYSSFGKGGFIFNSEAEGKKFGDAVLGNREEKRDVIQEKPEMREVREESAEPEYGAENKLVTTDRYEELKKRMREKLDRLNVGFDPELLSIGAEMAAYHVEAGARKFVDYSKRMIADLGDTIRPYLKSLYVAARTLPGMEEFAKEMDSYDEVMRVDVENFDKKTEVEVSRQSEKTKSKIKGADEDLRFTDFSYSTEGVEVDYPIQVLHKSIKRDMDKIVKAVAEISGFSFDTDHKGKAVYSNVNIAPAGGDVTFILWSKENPKYGVYVSVPYTPDYGGSMYDNYHVDDSSVANGILWRLTMREDKYKGMDNQHMRVNVTAREMAEMIKREMDRFLERLERVGKNDEKVDKEVQNDEVLKEKNSKFTELKDDENENIDARDRNTTRLGDDNDLVGVQSAEEIGGDVQQREERGVTRIPVGRTGEGGQDISEQSSGRDERNGGERGNAGRTDTSNGERGGVAGRTDKGSTDNKSTSSGDNKEPVRRVKRNARNFNFGKDHLELESGEISRIRGNIAAIETLLEIEKAGKEATREQKNILSKFVGWGGLANVLDEGKYNLRNSYKRDYNWNTKYLSHYERLKELLSEEEFRSALLSTTNAHYTSETVVRAIWNLVSRLGFRGGNVLEPAMGVGNFLGFMPKSISENSNITGFELDSVSGRISKALYPDAHIRVAGYETMFAPNSKDAIVTNVPFGANPPFDAKLDRTFKKELKGAFNLHNYFIGKGVLELKEGGLGVFITSAASLDGADNSFRNFIVSQGCDLVGAVRLPNNAFLKNAGTEVTTDILVIRKRKAGESSNGIQFSELKEVGTGTYTEKNNSGKYVTLTKPILVNEYFAEHPEMMLGKMMTANDAGSGGLYSNASLTCKADEGQDLENELNKVIKRFPKDVLEEQKLVDTPIAEQTDLRNGSLVVRNDKVCVAINGELSEIPLKNATFKYNGKTVRVVDAVVDYTNIKDTLRELIHTEQAEKGDPVELRARLNELYDAFVGNYGTLNANKNLDAVLLEDFEHNLPFSLENVRKESGVKRGTRAKIIVEKGKGILEKRVHFPVEEPTSVDSIEDAVRVSISYRGSLDLGYVAQLTGIAEGEVTDELLRLGVAYLDPISGKLVDKANYLSGDVRNKLIEAQAAVEEDSRFEKNVHDLLEVQPEPILFGDISYRLGTPWIPVEYIKRFAVDILSLADTVNILYSKEAGEWFVDSSGELLTDTAKAALFSTQRMNAVKVLLNALNQRKPKIFDVKHTQDGDIRVFNEAETQAATEKILEISDKFIEYVDSKKEWHKRLELIYNERYNGYRVKEYSLPIFTETRKGDKVVMHYPGASRDIVLREHQMKAVQRSLEGSTLLAHQVGTGKTFTMITTAMEMRRLKIARKPMIVVQNATLEDFAKDFLKLYPGANILVPSKNERSAENRKRLFNLIATGDYDAVIIPQSFLSFIPDNEDRKKQLIQQKIEEYERVLNEFRSGRR